MPKGLKRYYGDDHLHFLTCSCFHRQPWLGGARGRDLFLKIMEDVRQRYRFVVVGYVVMPDHVHLLVSEPERGTPSTVMQVLKQRYARRLLRKKRRKTGQGELWREEEQQRLAAAFLRLQCLERAQAGGEVAVHASQSGEARTSAGAGTVGVEQLSQLYV